MSFYDFLQSVQANFRTAIENVAVLMQIREPSHRTIRQRHLQSRTDDAPSPDMHSIDVAHQHQIRGGNELHKRVRDEHKNEENEERSWRTCGEVASVPACSHQTKRQARGVANPAAFDYDKPQSLEDMLLSDIDENVSQPIDMLDAATSPSCSIPMGKTRLCRHLHGLHCHYPLDKKIGAVTIVPQDIDTLESEHFVNDSIMDFFIKLVHARLEPESAKRMLFFNTFFYKKLTEPCRPSNSSRVCFTSHAAA